MTRKLFVVLPVVLALVACGGDDAPATPTMPPPPEVELVWERDPAVIIFQADILFQDSPPEILLNHIPSCTLYGDGRLIWTRPADVGETVMVAQLDDETIRTFLQEVVNRGFFGFQEQYESEYSYEDVLVSTLTAHFGGEHKVVEEFDGGAPFEFGEIYRRCLELSSSGQPFLPEGAWLTVTPRDDTSPYVTPWPEDAPLTLAEIAAASEPIWAQGDLLVVAWHVVHGSNSYFTAQEGQSLYFLVLQVPGLTPEAPPAP